MLGEIGTTSIIFCVRNILEQLGAFFLDSIEVITVALSVYLMVFIFLASPTQVHGASMQPNFHDGDCTMIDKISYRFHPPARGDVVVIHAPAAAHCPYGTGCDFFKRIIGLPGEKIQIINNTFYINDQQLTESYIPPENLTVAGDFLRDTPRVLGPDEYFVSGDNRLYSSDSRIWGPVKRSDIVGRAFFRTCPSNDMGLILQPKYTSDLR